MTSHIPNTRRLMDPLLMDALYWSDLDESSGRDPALRDALRAAVDELPEDQRSIIEGLFWECVSARDLCKRMGVTRSVFKRMRAQAFVSLQLLLEGPADADL